MPSKNPRLSVVLTPSLAALLSQLADETGESASSLVRDLLTQSEGALQRMLQLVVAAKAAKGQIGGGLAASMDRVVRDLETAQGLVDNRSADMLGDLVAMAEKVRPRRRAPIPGAASSARAGRVPEGGSTPVPVTRGSGPVSEASGGPKTSSPSRPAGRLFSAQEAEHLAAVASGRKPSALTEKLVNGPAAKDPKRGPRGGI